MRDPSGPEHTCTEVRHVASSTRRSRFWGSWPAQAFYLMWRASTTSPASRSRTRHGPLSAAWLSRRARRSRAISPVGRRRARAPPATTGPPRLWQSRRDGGRPRRAARSAAGYRRTGRDRRTAGAGDRQPRRTLGRHRPSSRTKAGGRPQRLPAANAMSTGADPVARKTGEEIRVVAVEQLAVRPERAAELFSMSDDFFRKHVLPHIAVVYVGRLRLVPIKALATWLEDNAVRRVTATCSPTYAAPPGRTRTDGCSKPAIRLPHRRKELGPGRQGSTSAAACAAPRRQ